MASRSLGVLTLDLIAKTGAFVAGMNKAERETVKSSRAMRRQLDDLRKTAVQAGAVFGTALVGATALIIKNTADAAREQAQLAAVLKSTGGVAGQTQEQLNAMADGLQQVSTFSAGNITEMQSLLLTFTKIQGDVFPKAQQAVLDMAQALGTDLKSQALQLGKALNDPIKGITALGRAGVQFSEEQKAMIKALVEAGDVAKAQEMILAELEVQFGGSARAASETLGGALTVLTNNFNDLLEGDSSGDGVRGATEAIRELSAVMADPQTKQAFASVIEGVAGVTAEIVQGIALWTNYIAKVNEMRGLATDNTLLDSAPYEKINERLGQVQQRLIDLDKVTDAGVLFNPVTFVSTAAGEDAGAEQARMTKGGFNPYSRSGEIEFLLKERERLIREGTERIKQDIANASGLNSGSLGVPMEDGGSTIILPAAGQEVGKPPSVAAMRKAEADAARDAAKAERELAAARADAYDDIQRVANAERDQKRKEAEELEAALAPGREMVENLKFELELMKMTNAERAVAIQLRGLDEEAVRKYGAEIKQLNADIEANIQVAEGMDVARDATRSLFSDLIDGSKSAKDAFKDFVANILDGIAQIVARNLTEQLLGDFGTTGQNSGGFGGFLSGLFDSFFEPRAKGGPVYPGKAYLVGEQGPELIRPMGAGMVSSASETRAALQGGRAAAPNVTFVLPGRNDMRTKAQMQADLARETNRQLSRGTA